MKTLTELRRFTLTGTVENLDELESLVRKKNLFREDIELILRTIKLNPTVTTVGIPAPPPPAVDAVVVVRCKDCKHRNQATGVCSAHTRNSASGEANGIFVAPNGYCNSGERKEG